ncbi:hypothetical protein E3Q13_01673 [Wallemia mellicola]|nr:hypothetical protein E3Q13_01673 [Wallemia mellicola]
MQFKLIVTVASITALASASFVPLNVARSPQYDYNAAPAPASVPAGSGYDQCVQQCNTNWDKGSVENTDDYGNDNGKNSTAPSQTTKHIIVAPSQGVLRFVPFAMQANVGDKIQFTWMANNHGVTKSSMTGICNATMDKPFKSPVQNSSATFETTVDTTDPMFYYCPHCTSGMYGIINPPMAPTNLSNVGDAMGKWEKDSKNTIIMKNADDIMKNANMTSEQLNWGNGWMDMSKNEDDLTAMIENIIITRLTIALNPGWTPGAPVDMKTFKAPPTINNLAATSYGDSPTTSNAAPEATDEAGSNSSGCNKFERPSYVSLNRHCLTKRKIEMLTRKSHHAFCGLITVRCV